MMMTKLYVPKMNSILLRSVTDYMGEYRKGFAGRPSTVQALVVDFINYLIVSHNLSPSDLEGIKTDDNVPPLGKLLLKEKGNVQDTT
jgi:hypothetical protein